MRIQIHWFYAWLSPGFRRRRLRRMHAMFGPVERLLDVGGYPWCWKGDTLAPARITLLNRDHRAADEARAAGFVPLGGDGCSLPFASRSFDVVFSNSVIEHVGSWERQQAFAAEVRRVGRRLWIQTPAQEFFIEPHLIAPFIHWLPVAWQRRLIRNFTLLGWCERPDAGKVDAFLAGVRLLTRADMQQLFPDCTILRERFLGLTKSYIAVRS